MSVFNMMDTWPSQGNQTQFLTGHDGLPFNTGQPFEQQHASFGLVISTSSYPVTGYQFVAADDSSHSPAAQTANVEAYQATPLIQALGDVEAWHGHGGGEIAFLIFLVAVFVWSWQRRPRHR